VEDFNAFVLFVPIIAALIGYWFRYFLDRKKELASEVNRERREVYQEVVDMVIGILKDVKSNKKTNINEVTKKLFNIYRKEILYASPKVINAFNDFMDNAKEAEKLNLDTKQSSARVLLKLASLLAAMRKDLGLSNRGFGKNHKKLLRSLIQDIDSI